MFTFGFRYKDKSLVREGDKVIVSKKIADLHAGGDRRGTVTGTHGFVTVELAGGVKIDLDMRSIQKS